MLAADRPIRVLVVQPPTTGGVRSLLPQIEEGSDGIGFKPPLGVLYVASMLRAHSVHQVRVIDAQAQRLTFAELRAAAQDFAPHLIGVSAWTDWWYPAWETGRQLKDALPAAHLCYGGPHVSIYPKETLATPFVDSVVVGDGEVPFLFLANMIANSSVDNRMPGLHLAQFGVTPAPDEIYIHGDLDSLPLPDRTLLPIASYGSVLSKGDFVTTMITSRGCPHRCTFCKLNFQKNIARSAESVVEEFKQIESLGIREVEIYDDTFTWNRGRLKAICTGLIEAGVKVEWAVRDRVSNSSTEHLNLMARAGCRRIHFGIESGVQDVLDRMQKRITLDQCRSAVAAAKAVGMSVLTYFMIGNIDESLEDMEQTIRFALELGADYAEFSITIPYAGTEMYETAIAKKLVTHDFWRDYAVAPVTDFMPQIIEQHADLGQLLKMRNSAIRRFYFRPRYLVREISNLASFGEFVRKVSMGLRLARSVYVK